MNVLYLINQYPKVSHTFIRREILSLEQNGVNVHRVAMRSDNPDSMSAIDKSEYSKTHYVLNENKLSLLLQFVLCAVTKPVPFFKALGVLIRMNKQSKQSFLKHLIYLLESCNVARQCASKNVDHIHAHFGTNPAEVAMYTSILSNTPYSFTVHGPEEFDKPLTLNLNEKIKHSSKVIAITSYCRSQLFRWADYQDWHKVKIVHCAIENEFFDKSKIQKVKAGDIKKFLCIGRLCEQKGQLLLLEAFKKFVQQNNRAHLTLAGDGEMRVNVEEYISKNDLQNNVTITGWIDSNQIKSLLAESDAMLLPSFAEGLPVAIMEAMATGVPVISTSIAGIPELLKHKKTGYLITPGSVDSIAEALFEFDAASSDELTSMKSAAFDAVFTEHNADTEAKKLASIFKE